MKKEIIYPVLFSVDYPEKKLSRKTTFFRLFMAIPIYLVLALLIGFGSGWNQAGLHYSFTTGGFVFLPTLLMILFRQKYPKWWYDWNLALTRFSARVAAYLFLLRDEYPSTDEEQAVHIYIPYPDAKNELNRWLPLIKWFLAIPHYIVLAFLYIAVLIVVVIAWFAILFTGIYPRGIFDFVVSTWRWSLRVSAYAFLLTTDRYPPFALE